MIKQESNQFFYKIATLVVLVILGVGLLALFSCQPLVNASASQDGQANTQSIPAEAKNDECSLKTLEGTFLFEARGVFMDGGELIHYVEVGSQNFDGEGNFDGHASISLNGEILETQQYFTGTYALKDNCMYSNFAPVDGEIMEFHLYTTPKGTHIVYFGPGVSGTAVKP